LSTIFFKVLRNTSESVALASRMLLARAPEKAKRFCGALAVPLLLLRTAKPLAARVKALRR
jgi:hypothetical protein